MNQTDLKGQKAQWAEILQEYDCKLRYCKGRYNIVADALSRMPEINLLLFTELKSELLESLRGKCEQDLTYSKVWNHVKMRGPSHSNGSVSSSSTYSSSLSQDELQLMEKFLHHDGYLLHKGRVCVPLDLDTRRHILYECHDSPSAGHAGI